jgi:hypothetical protein
MANDEDDDRYERRSSRPTTRQRVAAPAILMILSAVMSLLISGAMLALAITKPTVMADWYKTNLIDGMPNGILKEDMSKQFESTKDSMMLNSPMNLSYYILTLLAGLVMLYGAWQMKVVGSYRWAMVSALMAFIPLSGCSILAFPFGLFAIIRLSANDVVRGFHDARKVRHAD